MRLGQLSRKLDVKPTLIREFIRNEFKVEIDLDLNTRIEDLHVASITANFEKKTEPVAEAKTVTPQKSSEITVSSEFKEEVVEKAEKPVIHTPIEVPHYHETQHDLPDNDSEKSSSSEKTIITEEPVNAQSATETNESPVAENPDVFIPLPVNPDAELIKAPKIKLEGLKVVGKIELPGKKEKESAPESTDEVSEEQSISDEPSSEISIKEPAKVKRDQKGKSTLQQNNDDEEYSIFKDKRGIYHFSQTQRENRKNSIERIKLEKLEELRKQKKIKHYQKLVVTEKKQESGKEKTKKQAQRESKKQEEKPKRKGVWGKFLNWLND